jgi:hypothetical protein
LPGLAIDGSSVKRRPTRKLQRTDGDLGRRRREAASARAARRNVTGRPRDDYDRASDRRTVEKRPVDLEAIKARLLRAGYPPPAERADRPIREPGREAQEARAELREHIIEDVWALIGEVEAARAEGRGS